MKYFSPSAGVNSKIYVSLNETVKISKIRKL